MLTSSHILKFVATTKDEFDEAVDSLSGSYSGRSDATVESDEATKTVIINIEHGNFVKVNGVWVRE